MNLFSWKSPAQIIGAGTVKSVALSAIALAALSAPALAARTDIIVGMQLEPPVLDPTAGAAAPIDSVVYANIFEGLTRFEESGAIVPSLAKSWTVSEDELTYDFELHEGVYFHDGTSFDAEDVVFSFERAMAEGSINAQPGLFVGIQSVEAISATQVRFVLEQPNGNFLFNLAWGDTVIVAPESADENANNPIGTGPFVFDDWVQGDRIELIANDVYWGERPALKKITFKFIDDPSAAFAAMMAETIDAFPNYPAPETLSQFELDSRFNVLVGSNEGEVILAVNNKRAPLDDVRVRRALAHAIDREAIIDGVAFGYGTPIGTFFPPHHPAYVDLTAMSAYDLQKAKDLLVEAGAEDLSLTLKLPPPPYARRSGEIIASQLSAAGIDVTIENVDWGVWLEGPFKGDYDLTIVSHVEPFDIGAYANPDYYFGFQDEEFNQIIETLTSTSDLDARNALLSRAQTILAEQQASVYLYQGSKTGVANAKIEGLWQNEPTPANDMTKVRWID